MIGKSDAADVRHEDLTRLSFPSGSFDIILTFDVLEDIADYRAAFAECARTLKPAGKMLFSVPFDANAALNQIRARVRDPNPNSPQKLTRLNSDVEVVGS